jgi:hypothetical protein
VANLKGAKLQGAKLSDAMLMDAKIRNTIITQCQWDIIEDIYGPDFMDGFKIKVLDVSINT